MSELHRAALAFGAVATLMAATSAFAIDAGASEAPVSADTQQAVALVSGGVAAKASGDPSCPSVLLAPDGDTRRADGAKAKVEGLARDCANLGAETIMKIALVGEGERKRAKAPTTFDAPVTIQVKDGEGRDVETRRISLKVEMAEGVQKVSFRHVEENVSLPPPSADGYAKWTVIVGFDPTGKDVGEVADVGDGAGEADEAETTPAERPRVRNSRSARSKGSRSVRAYAVRSASSTARRRIVLTPAPAPVAPPAVRVTTTVRPAGAAAPSAAAPVAPGATVPRPQAAPVTGGPSGSSMARAAAAFTERRDRALQEQQRAQQPAPATRPTRPAQAAERARAPQPQAAVGSQPSFRTAGR